MGRGTEERQADRQQVRPQTEGSKERKTAEDVDTTAAPAEGLELVEIAEGVAVVGDLRTTYKTVRQ